MASFGTGIVRESVFVSELEKEFQNRLMSLSVSQNHVYPATTVEQWLTSMDMSDYHGMFLSNGFDDLEFMVNNIISFCNTSIKSDIFL